MKYFRHETTEKEITIYPFVCWHLGAQQSDEKFIDETIRRVEDDPTARWIYMGDGGECVTKMSKGDVYEQTLSPGEQIKALVEKLEPIKHKGLFLIKGNHGHRLYKEVGLEFDEMVALGLGLPYLGTAAFWHLQVNRSLYSIYSHHGTDSGVSIPSKINAAKKFENIIAADAIITAHSHIAMELPPRYLASLNTSSHGENPVKWTTTHEYIAGSAYDSRSGYAEEKGYPLILPSHISINFSGKRVGKNNDAEKKQTMQLWRASI